MLSGFYTVASGMMQQQRTLDVLTNNMANANTPGFRTERTVATTFEDTLLRQETANGAQIGGGAPITMMKNVPTNFDPSFLEETGRPFDVAIVGEGYYNIQGVDKQFLTRNGNFDIDDQGFLILPGVGRVLGKKGELQVKGSNFKIDTDGTVYDIKNKRLDVLNVTLPPADVQMQKYANGLYTVPDVTANKASTNMTLQQGQLESSNIDFNREYTRSMEVQRNFQLCSSVLKIMDQLNQKTATQIASL